MRNLKREKKLAGRIKCHGNKTGCVLEHPLTISKKTPKGTKPIKKPKKNYPLNQSKLS